MATAADNSHASNVNQFGNLEEELETILTSFDSCYAWNYGTVKEGLRDLYEKAKRDQWNATTQLAWDTDVDPEDKILPQQFNPLAGLGAVREARREGAPAAASTRSWRSSSRSSCTASRAR